MTQRKSERGEEITLDKYLWEIKYYEIDRKGGAMHIQNQTGISKNADTHCDGGSQ